MKIAAGAAPKHRPCRFSGHSRTPISKAAFSFFDVVREAQGLLRDKITSGEFDVPAGVSYEFAGSYQSQVRSERRLKVVLPLSLVIIFLILYFQFKQVSTTLLVFSGIFVAWSGGFLMLWLYGQDWFLNFSIFGENMRQLFQVGNVNLSVAVWVGFLALFGIATDDGRFGDGIHGADAVLPAGRNAGEATGRFLSMTGKHPGALFPWDEND